MAKYGAARRDETRGGEEKRNIEARNMGKGREEVEDSRSLPLPFSYFIIYFSSLIPAKHTQSYRQNQLTTQVLLQAVLSDRNSLENERIRYLLYINLISYVRD